LRNATFASLVSGAIDIPLYLVAISLVKEIYEKQKRLVYGEAMSMATL
jgi:hypothetical protein